MKTGDRLVLVRDEEGPAAMLVRGQTGTVVDEVFQPTLAGVDLTLVSSRASVRVRMDADAGTLVVLTRYLAVLP